MMLLNYNLIKKMKIRKINLKQLLLCTAFVCSASAAFAQDALLTQAYASPLSLNPALMGANSDLKVILNYKNLLGNIDKGYTTSSLCLLYPMYIGEGKQKFDLGFNVQNDRAGAFNKLAFSLALGYDLKLSTSGSLSVSLIGGAAQESLNVSSLTFDEQYIDGEFSSGNAISENLSDTKITHADAGFGVMWYYNPVKTETTGKLNCFAGISAFHLNSPNESVSSAKSFLPSRVSWQAGLKIVGDRRLDYSPNIRLNMQGQTQEITPGIYIDYRFIPQSKLVTGFWYRSNGPMALLVGVEHKNFSLGYSFDLFHGAGIARYASGTNASQLSLTYRYDLAAKKGVTPNASPFSSF